MINNEEIIHNCINCAERHNLCPYDASDNCQHFVLGKCFRCKYNGSKPVPGICYATDKSGWPCNNFKEKAEYYYTNSLGVKKMISITESDDEGEYDFYIINIENGELCGNGKSSKEQLKEFLYHYGVIL